MTERVGDSTLSSDKLLVLIFLILILDREPVDLIWLVPPKPFLSIGLFLIISLMVS